MLQASPNLLQNFTVFDVYDPDELGDDSRISQRFPGYNNYNTYRLRDRGVQNQRPSGLLSRLAVRREGVLTVASVESPFDTDIGIAGDGIRRLFLTFSLSGSIALQAGRDQKAVSEGTRGLVYRGLAGTRLLTADNSHRLTVQIDEDRLRRVLESLLGDVCPVCPNFVPVVDWALPPVAPIARMIRHLIEEVGDPFGMFTVPTALETFTDTLAHLVLARLPHSYSERLRAPRSSAIPRQLRRAEAFMVAHAGQPISLADIAAAAGCGARALQLAFRQFRGTTPLSALQEVRLQAVRAALSVSDAAPSVIAREFGFSNPARFRASYYRRFGEAPSIRL